MPPSLMPPRAAALLCTWFGLGRAPKAAGTVGSLGALPFAYLLHWAGGPLLLGLGAVLISLLGYYAIRSYLAAYGGEDPGEIVIDEVAGQWIALILAPQTLIGYALGFALFRFFDIVKPWPVSWADQKLGGALGVLLDDLIAGAMAAILLFILLRILPL